MLTRQLHCGLLASVVVATPAASAERFDAPGYLDRAIAIVRANALAADKVDWLALAARVHAEGDRATDVFDTYPALVTLVRGLGDHHSFLQLSGERTAAFRAAKGHDFVYPAAATASRADRRFYGRAVGSADRTIGRYRIRTLVVPGIMADAAARAAYAAALDRAVLQAPRPCGWVVDLRGNPGGNMWPMLAGLSRLLGEGRVGGSMGRTAAETEHWLLKHGTAALESADGGVTPAQAVSGWRPARSYASAPVAVLTDGGTGSSGELVAVAFAGRRTTRRFGDATAGVSTATEGFSLSDGANLVLVTAVSFDRSGVRYPHGLAPDEATSADAADAAAQRWVTARCAAR